MNKNKVVQYHSCCQYYSTHSVKVSWQWIIVTTRIYSSLPHRVHEKSNASVPQQIMFTVPYDGVLP
jgi:hypothetical protein